MLHHLKSAIRSSRERARYRREYRALMALDDHFLQDIGIGRDEIGARMADLGARE